MASDVGCLKQPIKYILKIFKKVLTVKHINVKIRYPKGKEIPNTRRRTKMKCDVSTKIYRALGFKVDQANVNKYVKAVIINFSDERGDIIVANDNFGTRRKYADFTNGKKKAGLNPMQIVFSDIDIARACGDRYVNKNDEVCYF